MERRKRALDGGPNSKFWLGMLQRKRTTVAELKEEIEDSKGGLARLARDAEKLKKKDGYSTFCHLVERVWEEISIREAAIEDFTKKKVVRTPHPTLCPPPMKLKHQDNKTAVDRAYDEAESDWVWVGSEKGEPEPQKPAGYDERKRLQKEEYEQYKARGFWGARTRCR
jgi:hypothetical protein